VDAPGLSRQQANLLRSVVRGELRGLLAVCRSRLRPQDVGLPATGRRRVPGLRREEVAELVGVSPNWYAAFEAGGNEHHFSPAFVQRVAAVLRMDERERVTLFRLTLPEASEVAEHFDAAQAAAGRSLATAIYRELIAEEALREARAATGRALATAIYRQLLAHDASREAPPSQ
jgi:transcriptional regulator with XRE-family HTH domain